MPVTPLAPLAAPEDVAKALGVSAITALPSTMQIRLDGTLAKVSRSFRKEAERIFTPGTYTHDLRVAGGAVRLMELPDAISRVSVAGASEIDWETGDPTSIHWTQEGSWIQWNDWQSRRLNGSIATVTYTWNTPVPDDVVVAVAEIVGRNLTVDPLGPLRQSKMLMSRYHRQDVADWVSSGRTGLMRDDIEVARSYRYPVPTMIVYRMDQADVGLSTAFLSDSSW